MPLELHIEAETKEACDSNSSSNGDPFYHLSYKHSASFGHNKPLEGGPYL